MRKKSMTTIRREYINGEWCYQVVPDDFNLDPLASQFVPWTKVPPEVMVLIRMCEMGLQDNIEIISANEWRVPSQTLKSWIQSQRDLEEQKSSFERHFRLERTELPGNEMTPLLDSDVRTELCDDLDQECITWIKQGFQIIGRVDVSDRGNSQSPLTPAIALARRIGATVILFKLWPAKLRAIKRLDDDSIDLVPLLADPPSRIRPGGFYVIKTAFLKPQCIIN
jgi:hypothetical protein